MRGLHAFAGAQARSESVSGWAHVLGHVVTDLDTGTGGAAHDVTQPRLLRRLRRELRGRAFDYLVAGGPCGTFSPLHVPQLRDTMHAGGKEGLPQRWSAAVAEANACWAATALLAWEIWLAGGEFVIEHPARRYLQGTRPFWRAQAAVATPGDLPELLELERATGAARVHVAQCACGGPFQKFST